MDIYRGGEGVEDEGVGRSGAGCQVMEWWNDGMTTGWPANRLIETGTVCF